MTLRPCGRRRPAGGNVGAMRRFSGVGCARYRPQPSASERAARRLGGSPVVAVQAAADRDGDHGIAAARCHRGLAGAGQVSLEALVRPGCVKAGDIGAPHLPRG